jgi:hypothetical protein
MSELSNEIQESIERYLNLFPEVIWDRYTAWGDMFSVFGWIARDDERSDFYTLDFNNGRFCDSNCSSARFSEEFWRRICSVHPEFPDDGHINCRRVEDLGWKVQALKQKGGNA